jgi:alcohol dehydrogenase
VKILGAVLEEMGRPGPYTNSRPIKIVEVELDPPSRHEVLVRVEAAGVCHSDLSVVDGSRRRPMPMLLGHEAAGVVIERGEAVDDLAVGDRVVMTFSPRCNECQGCATNGRLSCLRGARSNGLGELLDGGKRLHIGGREISHHLGVSAFATHAVVDHRSVVRVDDDVPPVVAALLGCAVLTGGGAVLNAARVRKGDPIIVVGLGGVGMAALITAISVGNGPVYGVDAMPAKLATALRLGAAGVFDARESVPDDLRAPIVIEAAGNVRALELAVQLTAPGGQTVTVGLPGPDARASISPLDLVAEGRSITGSYLGSSVPQRDIPIFVDKWRGGLLPIESLVSATIGLDDINLAMDELANGSALRQIIQFD